MLLFFITKPKTRAMWPTDIYRKGCNNERCEKHAIRTGFKNGI